MSDEKTPDLVTKLAQAGSSEGALLHFLLENIPDRIYFKDTESGFIRISSAMARFFGLESAYGAIGKTDFDFFTSEHAEAALKDEKQVMETGEPIVGKIEKETLPGGEVRWAITTKMALRSPRGEIIGTCGISKDFTAQKELEDALDAMRQQLLEAEKMQAVGRLAYGVAHEVRNPLNILHAGLDFIAGSPAVREDQSSVEILDEMKSAINRADAVIGALMETEAPSALNLGLGDLQELLQHALTALEPECGRFGINVVTDFATDLPPIKMDRSKIEQVFNGVLTNAIDAMKNGGELTVRARLKQLTELEIERDPGLRSRERFHAGDVVALVEVEDTGTGIPAEVLTKIFDPFFTTKETGAGTGLGLTICRKLVELHHGVIQIINREAGGTYVSIRLKLRT